MPGEAGTRPVHLEVAEPEDAGRLAIIQARAFLTELDYAPPEDQKRLRALEDPPLGPPDIMDVEETLQKIQFPDCVYYKILLGNRIVGGVIVAADAEKYSMENFWRIFVEPMYQNRGIGEEAMRQIYRLHPDVRRWRLGTPEFHAKNRHFYERMGFTYLETWQPEHTWFRSVEYENVLPQEERLKL
ncbi:MAG: GNAT family N-acetyltransferase [Candidatus Bipolaricaulia bacterium]